MRFIIPSLMLVIVLSGCQDTESCYLPPGTRARVVRSRGADIVGKRNKGGPARITFADESGPMNYIEPGSMVIVIEKKRVSGQPIVERAPVSNSMTRVRVRVEKGRLEGRVGEVVRAYLDPLVPPGSERRLLRTPPKKAAEASPPAAKKTADASPSV